MIMFIDDTQFKGSDMLDNFDMFFGLNNVFQETYYIQHIIKQGGKY